MYNHRFIIIKDTNEQPDGEITEAADSAAGEGQAQKFPSQYVSPSTDPEGPSLVGPGFAQGFNAGRLDQLRGHRMGLISSPPWRGGGEKIPPLWPLLGKALPSQSPVVFIGEMRLETGPAFEGCHPNSVEKAGKGLV